MAKAQTFRANVGVIVVNDKWEVLALERIDKDALKNGVKKGTGEWQMPQGGLDVGEEPDSAWKRELKEEIGVSAKDNDLIGIYPDWLAYELPKYVRDRPEVQAKQGRGQVQKWFYVRFRAAMELVLEPENPVEQEFCDYKWTSLKNLAEETWEVRRPIYRKLALDIDDLRNSKISKH
jgi:putative (di)nucleoside polyphosphate hydrolase